MSMEPVEVVGRGPAERETQDAFVRMENVCLTLTSSGTMPGFMLRDSPLLYYGGVHSWPPVWMRTGKGEHERPTGEVGVLKEVHLSIADPNRPDSTSPYNRLFLFIEHRGAGYVGCLLFSDAATCRQIGKILSDNCGRSIAEIGEIDLSGLL